MTALSRDSFRPYRAGEQIEPPVADGQTVRQGSLLEYAGAGRVQPHVAGADKRIAGVALSAGVGNADGTVRVLAKRRGAFRFAAAASVRATHVGAMAYGADDNTVTEAGGGATPVGVIMEAEGGSATAAPDAVWVDINPTASLLD